MIKLFLFIVLLFDAITFNNEVKAANPVKALRRYRRYVENSGLYSFSDHVEMLNIKNFNSQLYGKKYAWFIEFYASWCGDCQRFAPVVKAFAADVYPWKDMVPVGVIDCANEINGPVCREFEVVRYPTLRYFHENFTEGVDNIGSYVNIDHTAPLDTVRNALLKAIAYEQQNGRGKIFPDLKPYVNPDTKNIFGENAKSKLGFLIFEEPDSFYGPALALDYHEIPEVTVKYALPNNRELIKNVGVIKFPSIYILDNDKSMLLTSELKNLEDVRAAVDEYLKYEGIKTPERKIYDNTTEIKIPRPENMLTTKQQRELKLLEKRLKSNGDAVFQMDLETALRYSIKREISRTKNITGEAYEALKAYVDVLADYIPLARAGVLFLDDFRIILKQRESIGGEEIAASITSYEPLDKKMFSSPPGWLRCRGSSPKRRGFPCGMWTMFHYLTVNAAEINAGNLKSDPKEILHAMLGYIKHFFGCADCSNHFQEMAKALNLEGVNSWDSSILWLWKAHNTVNKRLAGDETEDPEFPKKQFPSPEQCSACRNTDYSWNESEVLKYLKTIYNHDNVRYLGTNTQLLYPGLLLVAEGKFT